MTLAKQQETQGLGTPFCGNCGYDLKGLTESPRCPECGKPLVDVLQRRGFGVGGNRRSKRYRSSATLFGLPVIDVAIGPYGDQRIGKARGIIAVGDIAVGFLAVGGISIGGVCVGGIAAGAFSLAGLSVGLLTAIGGVAISAGLAVGACAIGTLANGSAAIGYVAQGVAAYGHFFRDVRTANMRRADPSIFRSLAWLFGERGTSIASYFYPVFWAFLCTGVAAGFVGLLARAGLRGQKPK